MSKRKVTVVIPARMGSSRFPGKPLVKILDLPMIEHVRRRVALSKVVNEVYVATCDQEIKKEVERHGGKVIMTADTHQRCTDRVTEAIRNLSQVDIVAIISGDEPLFMPELVDVLVEPMMKDKSIDCTNLISRIQDEKDLSDTDIVKAVVDIKDNIMFFSRSPIPFLRVRKGCPLFRQTGLAAFTKDFLNKFSALEPTPMEIAESVDFLRILEHGYDIRAVHYDRITVGVDQKEHVKQVEDLINGDAQQKKIYQLISA